MKRDEMIRYCLKKPGAFLDDPFGPDVTIIKVKSLNGPARIFSQFFMLSGSPACTLNCDRMTGEFYRDLYPETITRGYHCPPVQQPYFNTIRLNGIVSDEELFYMIDHAYLTVISKFPKKYQRELSEAPREA